MQRDDKDYLEVDTLRTELQKVKTEYEELKELAEEFVKTLDFDEERGDFNTEESFSKLSRLAKKVGVEFD
jgi:hypothetical protein